MDFIISFHSLRKSMVDACQKAFIVILVYGVSGYPWINFRIVTLQINSYVVAAQNTKTAKIHFILHSFILV